MRHLKSLYLSTIRLSKPEVLRRVKVWLVTSVVLGRNWKVFTDMPPSNELRTLHRIGSVLGEGYTSTISLIAKTKLPAASAPRSIRSNHRHNYSVGWDKNGDS